ncbi:methyltransferase domain-containing protein [Streptomyces sp. NPDC086989]|uniref:class I SAM-dependent methyltransferase n=1 Tax=Streptomyces sp. NPDC086989 TaxID=3365764 RepID=UPI0038187669
MSDAEQYGDQLFSHAHPAEKARLEALAQALDPGTFHRLEQLPLPEDSRCLEVGSGLGTVGEWLVRRLPAGYVVAADRDPAHLRARDVPGLEVRRFDVTADDVPEGSFDLIHARWVLSHLPARQNVLERMARWLAPGGWLVIEDLVMFPLETSPEPQYRKVSLAMCDVVERRIGTDCRWARTLPELLSAAGLTDVHGDTRTSRVGRTPMGRFWRLSAEQLGVDLQQDFGITPDELAAFSDRVTAADFTAPGLATVTAIGRRAGRRERPHAAPR